MTLRGASALCVGRGTSRPGFGPMQVRRRGRGSALPQPRIRVRGRDPAGRSCTLFGRAGTLSCALFADFRTRPSGAWDGFRTRRCGSVHGPAGFTTFSVHGQARRGRPDSVHWWPRPGGTLYAGLLGAGGFAHWRPRSEGALYTGDPVPRGLCTLATPSTVQTPSGIHPPVRKVPLPPPDVVLLRRPRTSRTPSEDPHKVQKPLKRATPLA